MTAWIIGAVVAAFLLRIAWKAYTHPAHTLGRQAANMNWVAAGVVRDPQGLRNVRFRRGGLEAVVWYTNANVTLTAPFDAGPFPDFVQPERWLATKGAAPLRHDAALEHDEDDDEEDEYEAGPEAAYYRAIEDWLKSRGLYYESVMPEQLGDEPFFVECALLYKVGWEKRHPPAAVALFVAQAAKAHAEDPEHGRVLARAMRDKLSAMGDDSV